MAPRLLLLIVASVLAAGCGGEAETVTVTETVTETVQPRGDDDRAYALAEDLCRDLPVQAVAFALGVDARAPEALAQALALRARPELRDAARDGCLESLREEG